MEYLYLIHCNGFTKIGISNDVDRRIALFQTGNPYPLELLGKFEFDNALQVESILHVRYAGFRTMGEWFKLTDAQIEEVKDFCRNFDRSLNKSREIMSQEFAAELLRSALDYCIQAGVEFEVSNQNGSLVLAVQRFEYSVDEQKIKPLESVDNVP